LGSHRPGAVPGVHMGFDSVVVYNAATTSETTLQGLTLVHFSDQPKPFWSVSRFVSSL